MSKYIDATKNTSKELIDAFDKVESDMRSVALYPPLHVAPSRPQGGKLYFADGTDWNPGSGRGMYVYDEGATSYRYLG